jgi:class 3 adenylate cyclase
VASFAQVGIALSLLLLIGLLITISNLKMLGEVNAKKMMERYLPPELIGEMYKSGTSLLPGGATREVAILFSDIRGFTELSESMKAEEVVNFLNGYLSRMTDVIFRHGGTLDKFIGDAIMTVFGAPVRRDNDELRAVQTAIDMQKAIVDLPISISVGIGVHSGEAVVGNIGSEKRLDYTVIGDNVNLCSRIEGLTKYYGTPILISDSVLEKLPKQCEAYGFFIRPIDRVVVKGRSGVVGIHEVLWFDGEEQKGNKAELKNDFEKAHLVFIQRDFRAAQSLFEKIGCDSVSAIYVQRCKEFIKNPPPANWNGAFVMRNK